MKGRKITILLSIGVLAMMVTPVFANGNGGFSSDLLAGRKLIDVGDVYVYGGIGTLIIEYKVEGCYLLETHLMVVDDPGLFPVTKKGNPQVGLFTYSTVPHDPITTEFTYEVPVSGSGPFYIAAHAVVFCGCKVQTAWGDTDGASSFGGKNWAFYFEFSLPT
jgi:hypothetical protein